MSYVISVLLLLIYILFFIYVVFKNYKSFEGPFEKIFYFLFIFVYFIPIIIYLIDRFDLLSKLGYANNIDTNRWFDFIGNYVISVVSSIISGVVLFSVTFKQIEHDNYQKDIDLKEQRRVNNIPVIKYHFVGSSDFSNNHLFVMSSGENNSQGFCILCFELENIGLNTARNIACSIRTDDFSLNSFSVSDDENYILKVGIVEQFGLMVEFDYKKSFIKNIIVTFYYDDLFNNHYEQDVQLTIKLKPCNSKRKKEKGIEFEVLSFKDFRVNKEKIIKE